MYENSKALFPQQSRYGDLGKRLRPTLERQFPAVQSGLQSSLGMDAERMANRIAMEKFGRAVARLLECTNCYVATMLPHATSKFDEVRIGHGRGDPSCAATVEHIARQKAPGDCTLVEHVSARTNFVRKLIGVEADGNEHSVIGRMSISEGAVAVFVAGWRPSTLSNAEIPCVVRAIRMIWETTQAATATDGSPRPRPDHRLWLEDLIYPAIIVDEELLIHEINGRGRALLTRGEFLRADHGTLFGTASSVTENLKKALSSAQATRSGQSWLNAMVPLSVDSQRFAFARVGAIPGDPGKILVIVPQFDEASGASRIACAFGLTWAEERIVTRILQGHRPRRIGAELHLTEETVRTYIKRIMLKLGINRQSEFFLLYHLTSSPFGASARSKPNVHQFLPSRLAGRAH